MIPGTIIVVVGADVLTQGLTEGRIPLVLVGVIIITALVLGLIVWYARRQLEEKRKN
jgi:Ca2+/Na+ antiporter